MKVVSVSFLMSLSCACALGETVRFEPASRTVDLGTGVTTTTFEVHVESTIGVASFNSIDLLIGSDSLVPSAFAFDAAFEADMDFQNAEIIVDPPGYVAAIFAGGFAAAALTRPILVGTVTVDVAGLTPGDYVVEVNADKDGGASGVALLANLDPLFGSATVTVVGTAPPECTTDAACDDGDACTADQCVGVSCVHSSIADCASDVVPTEGSDQTPGGSGDANDTGGGDLSNNGGAEGSTTEIDLSGGSAAGPGPCGSIGMILLLSTFTALVARRLAA